MHRNFLYRQRVIPVRNFDSASLCRPTERRQWNCLLCRVCAILGSVQDPLLFCGIQQSRHRFANKVRLQVKNQCKRHDNSGIAIHLHNNNL